MGSTVRQHQNDFQIFGRWPLRWCIKQTKQRWRIGKSMVQLHPRSGSHSSLISSLNSTPFISLSPINTFDHFEWLSLSAYNSNRSINVGAIPTKLRPQRRQQTYFVLARTTFSSVYYASQRHFSQDGLKRPQTCPTQIVHQDLPWICWIIGERVSGYWAGQEGRKQVWDRTALEESGVFE